jgi:hypothetical protein
MQRRSKAWIFVSHSTKDIEGVRRLRNELEERGAEPLLFFLKALDEQEELRTLLRREIDARHYFLLCDSVAARESPWVQEEREYVRSLSGKHVTSLTLDADWQEQLVSIDAMLKSATAFLSYSHSDRDRVQPFADLLADHDLAVWTELQLQSGQNWQTAIEGVLRKAAEDGYLIAFLSRASLSSLWVAHEIAAFQQLASTNSRLILIDLEPINHLLPPQLQAFQRLQFYSHSDGTNRQMLLSAVGLG